MLALIQKYKEEDIDAQRKRGEEVRLTRIEVFEANKSAIERKELAKQREKDEEEAILLYQAQKEEEKARLMKERQAKLLAMQEKTQNKQAEIDELRARRYAEERERRERERERKELTDKHSRMIELQNAREAVMQQQEYEDAVTYSLQTMEREKHES